MRMKTFLPNVLALLMLFALEHTATAQSMNPPVRMPDASPKEVITHEIGITDVTISYHSPDVKGRKVWGGLVPYDRVWRAGANENTTISFANDVKINGKPLAAGMYGLHVLPSEKEWVLIFSKNTTSWGSFSYDQKEDVLRVNITPQEIPVAYERLKYEFNKPTDSTTEASLCWEKMKGAFTIETNTKENTLAMLRNEFLRSPHKFDWMGHWFAANYAYTNNINLEEALVWINRSLAAGNYFVNARLKADILTKLGRTEEAKQAMDFAIRIGNPFDLSNYANFLLRDKKPAEALVIAKKLESNFSDLPAVTSTLARTYSANGNYPEALKYAKMSLEKVPEANKAVWQTAIKKLEEGKDMNQ
ncbi:MAG: DUF2911 domain-containing protein [Bacteroidota bacterium]